jgi:hypothetical protein
MPEPTGYPQQVPQRPVTCPPAASQVPPQPGLPHDDLRTDELGETELIVYSHSSLFYWWPIWVAGYVLALVTYLNGVPYREVGGDAVAARNAAVQGPASDIHRRLDGDTVVFHRSSNLGVIFFLTIFLTILITNVTIRGLASVIVIMGIVLGTVLLAYFNLWDELLDWLGGLKIYLNLGAYFWFATLMFAVWVFTVFVFDRLSYWRIKPGQVTQEFVLGAASRSYDTENMVLEKFRDDFFRHWLLGMGSGDLRIKPYGSDREEIDIPNVLFVGTKVQTIRRMIATEPAKFGHTVLR